MALSILMAPSIAQRGDISTIVPIVSHVDHTEHDMQVSVTEHGLADLRGLSLRQRGDLIIEECSSPVRIAEKHALVEKELVKWREREPQIQRARDVCGCTGKTHVP